MHTYTKFIISIFLKSLLYVFLIILSLVTILTLLGELDFFKEYNVGFTFPIYMAILDTPSSVFEIFPFIFLISTQLFFINLFDNNQLHVFKYSGLKNSKILKIISVTAFFIGIFIIFIFYNLSSNLKNGYLTLKNKYTNDDKYLAVITKNGLWIKDVINQNSYIINASKIEDNFLIDSFITQFNNDNEIVRNIKSHKIDIKTTNWIIHDPIIFKDNSVKKNELLRLKSNFNYKKIQSLFSSLSSLSMLDIINLRQNYIDLNYSTTEVDIQIHKLISYPVYLSLMVIISATIMFNTRKFKSSTLKISFGLFLSVLIYYLNNFFHVLGNTEKISYIASVWVPILILTFINAITIFKINEK